MRNRSVSLGLCVGRWRVLLVLACLLVGLPAAMAAYTPARGSAERKAILNALRVPVQRNVHQSVEFRILRLRVQSGWAFVEAEPQRPGGGKINYRGTRYWPAVQAGAFGGLVHGLLRKQGGRWRVVTYVVGASDVVYSPWARRYGAPRAIFPYSE